MMHRKGVSMSTHDLGVSDLRHVHVSHCQVPQALKGGQVERHLVLDQAAGVERVVAALDLHHGQVAAKVQHVTEVEALVRNLNRRTGLMKSLTNSMKLEKHSIHLNIYDEHRGLIILYLQGREFKRGAVLEEEVSFAEELEGQALQ